MILQELRFPNYETCADYNMYFRLEGKSLAAVDAPLGNVPSEQTHYERFYRRQADIIYDNAALRRAYYDPAVKALHHLPEELSLVLVGRSTKYAETIRQYAAKHGLTNRVKLLHGVSDEELPALYAGAEAFVYPSRYEGFGIPIIEAIAMGLPVVACTGSCLEEAGGPDSLYVAPDDAEGLAAAVRQVLRGAAGREQRIARSREYIQRFEGNDVAQQVIDVYRKVM